MPKRQCPTAHAQSRHLDTRELALRGSQHQAGLRAAGGPRALRQRLLGLRGAPVVINHWASWCDRCRGDLPYFAAAAGRGAGQRAFLGVVAQDAPANATAAIGLADLPYPQFSDIEGVVARGYGGDRAWPTTVFYSSVGQMVHVHRGPYGSAAALEREIVRFAPPG